MQRNKVVAMPSDPTEDMTRYYGPNAGYVLDLYERYQREPASVDDATRADLSIIGAPSDGGGQPRPQPVYPGRPRSGAAPVAAAARPGHRQAGRRHARGPARPLAGVSEGAD